MIGHYKTFDIELIDEQGYSFESTDNLRQYNNEYFDNASQFRFNSKHGIIIRDNKIEVSSAIISCTGGGTIVHPNSFLIKNDFLFICCGSNIYSLHIPSLNLIWNKRLDTATCFGIYEFENDFIIHGELEISRLTEDGTIKWQFSGRDIFVNIDNRKEFEIIGDRIKLIDFENFHYILDANGNKIK